MSEISKPMVVKPLERVRQCRRLGHSPRPHEVAVAESNLADAWAKDQATHAENEAAIVHNQSMRALITKTMVQAGVPDHFYAAKSDRPVFGRLPKKVKHDAGYLGDLKRTFPISDGFIEVQRLYDMLAKEIEEAKAKVQAGREAEESQRAAALERRKADLVLAGILVRHGLPAETDWADALDALRKKDKYLDLAIAGQQTRGDWSDGFYRVESALKRFTIENDQDKNIAADLCGCLRARDDGENDGRIFRDTTWSYDKLFGLVVDQQLLADARVCLQNMRDN